MPPGGMVEAFVTLVGHDLMSDELVAGASELARGGARCSRSTSPPNATTGGRTSPAPAPRHWSISTASACSARTSLLAHAVHLDDDELDVALSSGSAIACCPWAYLRLAQGITVGGRHLEYRRRGGRLALGCDAETRRTPSTALRAAALFVGLERERSTDPRSITAADGLALVTSAGAEAVGMGDRIGSLEPGRQADIVLHDTSGPQWVPRGTDAARQLVWASDGRSVSDVVVAGRVVVAGGRFVTVDVEGLRAEAAARRDFLLRAAGH